MDLASRSEGSDRAKGLGNEARSKVFTPTPYLLLRRCERPKARTCRQKHGKQRHASKGVCARSLRALNIITTPGKKFTPSLSMRRAPDRRLRPVTNPEELPVEALSFVRTCRILRERYMADMQKPSMNSMQSDLESHGKHKYQNRDQNADQ